MDPESGFSCRSVPRQPHVLHPSQSNLERCMEGPGEKGSHDQEELVDLDEEVEVAWPKMWVKKMSQPRM